MASARKRRRGSRAQRRARGAQSQKNYMPIIIGAVAVVLVLAVGFAVVQAARSSGGGSNFEFSLYQGSDTLGADKLSLEDVLGMNKPVVLNFWAGDCPPCRAEMPAFQRVYEQHSDDVIFLGMDVGIFTGLGTEASGRRLLQELGITYPAGAPPNRSAVVRYSVRSMPTTIFFDATGKVIDRADGAITEFRLATLVDKILEPA